MLDSTYNLQPTTDTPQPATIQHGLEDSLGERQKDMTKKIRGIQKIRVIRDSDNQATLSESRITRISRISRKGNNEEIIQEAI